jgi:hypothetical protein
VWIPGSRIARIGDSRVMRRIAVAVALAVVGVSVGVWLAIAAAERERARCWDEARGECGPRCSGSTHDELHRNHPGGEEFMKAAREAARTPEGDAEMHIGFVVGALMNPRTRACIERCAGRVAARDGCGIAPE